MSETTGRTVGPWQDRVAFSPEGGGVAYRPGEVYVRSSDAERAEGFLGRERDAESAPSPVSDRAGALVDPVAAVHDLRLDGIAAELNHVLFSHCCCCGPHPTAGWGANPFQANAHGRRHTARPARAPKTVERSVAVSSYQGHAAGRAAADLAQLDQQLVSIGQDRAAS